MKEEEKEGEEEEKEDKEKKKDVFKLLRKNTLFSCTTYPYLLEGKKEENGVGTNKGWAR